jgi:phosphohistidine phosphatase SixA
MWKASMSRTALFLLVSAAVLGMPHLVLAQAQQPSATQAQLSGELVGRLRSGGYILYMRHPQTDQTQKDADLVNLGPCTAQRNLTDQGRRDARVVGETLRKLRIPVSRVLSSQFCRASEAASVIGVGDVTTTTDLNMTDQAVPHEENERRFRELRELLSTAPQAGTNVLVIGHRPNIDNVAGKDVPNLAEGEIAIFAPQEAAAPGFRFVTRVSVAQWADLAELAAR